MARGKELLVYLQMCNGPLHFYWGNQSCGLLLTRVKHNSTSFDSQIFGSFEAKTFGRKQTNSTSHIIGAQQKIKIGALGKPCLLRFHTFRVRMLSEPTKFHKIVHNWIVTGMLCCMIILTYQLGLKSLFMSTTKPPPPHTLNLKW